MAVISGEDCQDAHDDFALSEGSKNIPDCNSQIFIGVSSVNSPEKSYDSRSECQYLGCVKVNDLDIHTLSNLDLDIEEGRLEIPKSNDDTTGVFKSEDSRTEAVRSKIRLHVGGRFMQLLTNNGLGLPEFMSREKSTTERMFDTSTSRSRKYKRSASFNSRRVVLLFSVLSSLGTVILILLTLRQIGDGSANF